MTARTIGPSTSACTLLDLVRERSTELGDELVYRFLEDGDEKESTLSFRRLEHRALAIAAALQERGLSGQPVVLLFPPGLDYVAGLFGCFCAGSIAVPAHPPIDARAVSRLQRIIENSRARVVLGTGPVKELCRLAAGLGPARGATSLGPDWLCIEEIDDDAARRWQEPALGPEDVALLQYTSGSTSDPKGVILLHRNLLHNLRCICGCFAIQAESSGVIWLPPYHDMGLVGGILFAPYVGRVVTLFSPIDFLKQPLRWLRAVSRYRADVSGGPNFAYEICTKRVTEEQKRELDLGSWRVAFNGAEPVRAATLERFYQAFRGCGFRREALYPCYGLAEASLIVTGGAASAPPVVRRQEVNGSDREWVGCGRAVGDQQLVVVDASHRRPLPDGKIGEIWLRGDSVAAGYWGQPELSEETFHARLENGEGDFMRTGDLGFVIDGELFITGRQKDLVVIDGRNLHPEDLEQTAEAAHPHVRGGGCAVFSVPADDGEAESLAAVIELSRAAADSSIPEVARAVVAALGKVDRVALHQITFVAVGALPKTLSGKKQRLQTRKLFLDDDLPALGRWKRGQGSHPGVAP